jgi:hypothetical protein
MSDLPVYGYLISINHYYMRRSVHNAKVGISGSRDADEIGHDARCQCMMYTVDEGLIDHPRRI